MVANPIWNQPFNPEMFANDPFDRFRTQGGVTTGKGDWAWLQHTLACLNERGRAAVVIDTGAVTRGSGARHEDRERNIRKWFVEHDLIDGVILLPDNLFYNTPAAGVIVVLSKRKSAARKDRIILLNASRRVRKGQPKNYIPEEEIRPLATAFLTGEAVEGEIAVITREQAKETDYNLNPSRCVGQTDAATQRPIKEIVAEMQRLDSCRLEPVPDCPSRELRAVVRSYVLGYPRGSRTTPLTDPTHPGISSVFGLQWLGTLGCIPPRWSTAERPFYSSPRSMAVTLR